MQIDLTTLSRADLETLGRDVEKALEELRKQELKQVREELKRIAAAAGVTVEEAMGLMAGGPKAKRVKTASVAKYANPADATQTWTGKGRQPSWFKDALQAGVSPDTMEI